MTSCWGIVLRRAWWRTSGPSRLQGELFERLRGQILGIVCLDEDQELKGALDSAKEQDDALEEGDPDLSE